MLDTLVYNTLVKEFERIQNALPESAKKRGFVIQTKDFSYSNWFNFPNIPNEFYINRDRDAVVCVFNTNLTDCSSDFDYAEISSVRGTDRIFPKFSDQINLPPVGFFGGINTGEVVDNKSGTGFVLQEKQKNYIYIHTGETFISIFRDTTYTFVSPILFNCTIAILKPY